MRELAGKRALIRVVKKVGKMNGPRGFAANDLDDARMSVPESIDGDAAEEIQILFAARVVNVATAPMREDNGLTLIGRKKILVGIAQYGSRL